jgi:hypothetical protein
MPKSRRSVKKKTATHETHHTEHVPVGNQAAFPEQFYRDPLGIDRYVVQEKVLFQWRAPSKIDRKRTSAEKAQLMMILLFCIVITLLLGEIWVAVVFASLAGLYVIMMNAQPTYYDCLVTTLGIKAGDKYYFWPDMSQFWFEERGQSKVLYLRVMFPVFHTVKLIFHPADEEALRTTMGMYLLYKKPQQTNGQRLLKTMVEKFPIDLEFLQL